MPYRTVADLPKAQTGSHQGPVPNVTVTLTAAGKVFVNQKETTIPELPKEVSTLAGGTADALKALNEKGVVINADTTVEHGKVVSVMDALRSIDITHFGIATDGSQ